jgi:hypothetical protein
MCACMHRDHLLYYTLKTKCAIFDDLACMHVYVYVCTWRKRDCRKRLKLPRKGCRYVRVYACVYVCMCMEKNKLQGETEISEKRMQM